MAILKRKSRSSERFVGTAAEVISEAAPGDRHLCRCEGAKWKPKGHRHVLTSRSLDLELSRVLPRMHFRRKRKPGGERFADRNRSIAPIRSSPSQPRQYAWILITPVNYCGWSRVPRLFALRSGSKSNRDRDRDRGGFPGITTGLSPRRSFERIPFEDASWAIARCTYGSRVLTCS